MIFKYPNYYHDYILGNLIVIVKLQNLPAKILQQQQQLKKK